MSAPEPPIRVYPERQRCRKCRNYFGPLVIMGEWCSYLCAGLPAPSLDSRDWPRQHWYPWRVGGGVIRRAKAFYNSQGEARASPEPCVVYRCTYCYGWHRASIRPS